MSEIVALLLDDAMPPERLGELLRAARKRKGLKRKQAAAIAHTTKTRLRDYEQGSKPIPPDVCARLAECYGTDLSAHVPVRVPPKINQDWLIVEEHRLPRVQGTPEEVVREYAQIVARLRNTKPGEMLPLRAADLAVLGSALESDPDEIAARIATILHCSVDEARGLHREMLRRKVVLPIAGLAASVVALAGVNVAQAATAPAHHVSPTTTQVTLAPTTTTTPTAHVAAPKPTVPPTAPPTSPPTTEAPRPVVTDPPATTPPTTDDPPVSVLPGETPVSIIGTAITTVEPNDQ
jgi:transcriptional regulator with XRE-family HTH domain